MTFARACGPTALAPGEHWLQVPRQGLWIF